MNNENFNFNYPHLKNESFKFDNTKMGNCINAYITDSVNDKYFSELKALQKESWSLNPVNNKNLVRGHLKDAIVDRRTSNYCQFTLNYIDDQSKFKHDNFLKFSNYKNKIDKNGFYTYGCIGEKQTFIGGSKEMINLYCNINQMSAFCLNLVRKTQKNEIDSSLKLLFNDSGNMDKILTEIPNIFK